MDKLPIGWQIKSLDKTNVKRTSIRKGNNRDESRSTISNWQVKSLGEVAEFITTGKTPSTKVSDYFGGQILWFTPSDIGISQYLNLSERTLTQKAILEGKAVIFPKDTLLITCIGNIGRVGILQHDGSSNQQITGIKFNSNIDVNYAYYWFRKNSHHLIYRANKAIVPILNNSQLREIKIEQPPLSIQKQIAEILEKTDQAKQKRKEANKLTEQFLQSAFIEMFGDPVKNTKGWSLGKIENAVQYSEYGSSYKSNKETLGYPILSMSNITFEGGIDLTKLSYVELSDEEFKKLKLEKGNVIFNRTNSTELIGKTTYWNKDIQAVIASYLVKLKLTKDYDPIWFSYLLNTKYYKSLFALKCKKAVNQSNISPTLLKEFPMYNPPLSLQQQFVELVKKTEVLKEKQKESEKELENLFNSLMQKAFKGELT